MKNVLEYLENCAAVWPDKPGVTDEKGAYTFREVYKKSRSIASALANYLKPRQAAAVFMPKGKDALLSSVLCIPEVFILILIRTCR